MHGDLHVNNWLLRENYEIVIGDFGCAKVLGHNGKVEVGTVNYYFEPHSPPEMQCEHRKTKEEFSFNGDTWQLGFAFQAMLNQGHWYRPTPSTHGQDVVDLIAYMHTKDKRLRPQMAEVVQRIGQILEDFEAE
mmetsp:Transcript_1893/g.1316  ORF Transcript_1893/g.1316 Transcript_1893/m.1316 type:complete len:133 (+) Transcript_1893:25-423(+)